jgi:hypothetical protein
MLRNTKRRRPTVQAGRLFPIRVQSLWCLCENSDERVTMGQFCLEVSCYSWHLLFRHFSKAHFISINLVSAKCQVRVRTEYVILKCSRRNLLQCHLVHHKSHSTCPNIQMYLNRDLQNIFKHTNKQYNDIIIANCTPQCRPFRCHGFGSALTACLLLSWLASVPPKIPSKCDSHVLHI